MNLLVPLLTMMLTLGSGTGVHEKIVIPAVFSDNMVLQQNSTVSFWGKGEPGMNVKIWCGWGEEGGTQVQEDGNWKTSVKTCAAGGPYGVKIVVGDSAVSYSNVMLGEVWLCSGQSNMEMPLEGWPQNPIMNSTEEIKNASYPDIRLFTVSRAVSDKPEFNCKGAWSECTPQTASQFSAAAYFFGRKLYKELKVPIGLIFSSWGGTKIQSWTGGKYLEQLPEYRQEIKKIAAAGPGLKKLNDWIKSHPSIDVSTKKPEEKWKDLNFDDSNCSKPEFNDSAWKEMKLPEYWEATEVGNFDGAVWFRKKINIPAEWVAKDLVLKLGPIDDVDETFVNGVKVGGMEEEGFYAVPRIYDVPAGVVKDSALTIAVRVIDFGGGGGLWGKPEQMEIYSKQDTIRKISLAGNWKYLPVAEYKEGKFYVYGTKGNEFYLRPESAVDVSANTPTMLYNGMIAPLIPYRIKGVIWYQGESNSNTPDNYNNYKTLFPLMIKNWRSDWNEGDFPFYYVQIAPFTYDDNSKSQAVRYAQFQTLSVPNTGMAVTLDIGSLKTIHPANKQEVGRRLALWALAKNYGKNVTFSGPLYQSMKIEDGKIILTFKYADGGLVLKDINGKTNFIIAGKDRKFIDASVKVEGNKLIVFSRDVKEPVAVRYAWSNTAEGTLFNKAGLPASTFKTDDWGN